MYKSDVSSVLRVCSFGIPWLKILHNRKTTLNLFINLAFSVEVVPVVVLY